jgi:hypothetical protein
MDAFGLVYEKQGNTGAAAFNKPTSEVGANPLDVLAQQAFVQNREIAKEKAADNKLKQKTNMAALNIDLSGWDYDNKAHFIEKANELRQKGAALAMAGKDLSNFADKDVLAWKKDLDIQMKAAEASKNQAAEYKSLREIAVANPDKFDYDKTMEAANKYMLMTPDQRINVDPKSLLVRKYDAYTPVMDIDVNKFAGSYGYKGTTSYRDYTKLDEAKLKKEIQTRVENETYDPFYTNNKAKYGWKDKNEYADWLFQYKKNQFVPDSKGGVIVQDSTPSTGLTMQQLYDSIANTKELPMSVATISVNGYTVKDEKGETKFSNIPLYHPQGVVGLNVTVPGADIISTKTNQKGVPVTKNGVKGVDTKENYTIQNGNLGIALVYKSGANDGKPVMGSANTLYFKDSKGNRVAYTLKEAYDNGYIEYRPILQGNATYKENDIEKVQPAIVDASKYMTPDMVSKSDDANDAYRKYLVLVSLAQQKNAQLSGQSQAQGQVQTNQGNSMRSKYGY